MIYKRLLAFFLSFALIFSSTSALANTSLGGWTVLDSLIVGSNTTINAVKGAGSTALKSAITVAPSALKVGGFLLRGGAVGVLAMAIPQLIGEGVDYVLDPANNTIVYDAVVPASSDVTSPYSAYYQYTVQKFYYDADVMCKAIRMHERPATTSDELKSYTGSVGNLGGAMYFQCFVNGSNYANHAASANPNYNSSATTTESRTMSISDVATQVIANAESGHLESQDAIKAVSIESFVAGEYDAALDASAIPDTSVSDPATTSDPATSDSSAASNTLLDSIKSLLSNILSSITSLSDWFKGEPEANSTSDNNIDIPEVPLPDIDSAVSFGGSCPSDLGVDFNLYGTNFNFVLMPFSKLCPLLSTFIKPTLILLGSFMAVSIVGGRKDA